MEKNNYSKLLGLILSFIVLVFMLTFIFSPKQIFSENENRYLTKFPSFSWDNLVSGKFIDDLDSYLIDHFPFRDTFVSIKTKTELLLGKRKINDVFIGDDGYLITDYEKPSRTKNLIQVLNSFKIRNNHVNMNLMLIPTSVSVNKKRLPAYASPYDELKTINYIYDNVNFSSINVYDTLLENNDIYPTYYKLDHHYTSYGAYYVYLEYCEQNNLECLSINDYNIEAVTNDFKGTLYSKVNFYSKPDTIHIFTPKDGQDLKVEYISLDDVITRDSLYEYQYLEKKDKYSIFLNGNNPLVKITNNKNRNGKKLLVIKDSFANALIPFLTYNYSEVHVIDPRYYKLSISEYIDKSNITDVLFLYNINTLDKDTGIYSIK